MSVTMPARLDEEKRAQDGFSEGFGVSCQPKTIDAALFLHVEGECEASRAELKNNMARVGMHDKRTCS